MKKLANLVLIASLFAPPVFSADIEVGFSPGKTALPLVLETIKNAKSEVLVAAYSFTSKPIALELVEAQKRGVNVQVVADEKSNGGKYTAVTYLQNHNVPTRLTSKYAIMHNKFLVVDGTTVGTGSFNFTAAAASRNAENVVVIKDKATAKKYKVEFIRLWDEVG